MYDNRIFEVLKVEQQGKYYSIGGRFLHTINVGDQLIAGNQTMTQFCLLIVRDIITYGQHFQQLDKGFTGLLVVDVFNDCEVNLRNIKYLYKGIEDDNYIQSTSWKYLAQDVDFVFVILLIINTDSVYKITGMAIQNLQIGNKLTITKDLQPQSPVFVINDITVSLQNKKYHHQELQRGEIGTIVLNKTKDIDFSKIEYLYITQ